MKSKARPASVSRQRRQQPIKRRSSFDTTEIAVVPHVVSRGATAILPCVDLRTIPQKITDLQEEMRDSQVIPTDSLQTLHSIFCLLASTSSSSSSSHASLRQSRIRRYFH